MISTLWVGLQSSEINCAFFSLNSLTVKHLCFFPESLLGALSDLSGRVLSLYTVTHVIGLYANLLPIHYLDFN